MTEEDDLQKQARQIKKKMLDREREFAGALAGVWAALSANIGVLYERLFTIMRDVNNTAPSQVSKEDLLNLEMTKIAIAQTIYYADQMAEQWAAMIEQRERESIDEAQGDANDLLETATAAALLALILQAEVTTISYALPGGVADAILEGVLTGPQLREVLLSRVGEFLNEAIGSLAEAAKGTGSAATAAAEALAQLSKLADTAAIVGGDQAARAYREALLAVYSEASKELPIIGYRRVSKRDGHVCLGCIILDYKFYKLGEPFAEHPRGRCISVPVFEGQENDPDAFKGTQWLTEISKAQQEKILGARRYQLWRDGKVKLDDLVEVVPGENGFIVRTIPLTDIKTS